MRLITWNCQGAFRKKAEAILAFQPDILVVQECENPDKLKFNPTHQKLNVFLWFGDNQHKGLGVYSFNNYKLRLFDQHNPAFKIVVPMLVSGGQINFNLFAIWANNTQDKENQYIEQVWKAVNHYEELLINNHTILAGDFNSNRIGDRKHREGNHSAVVNRLADRNIYSLYHKHFIQEQGKEIHPTFYLQRNRNKPYHIDYCFASKDFHDKLQNIEIGSFENWISLSDHSPLIFNFDL